MLKSFPKQKVKVLKVKKVRFLQNQKVFQNEKFAKIRLLVCFLFCNFV